MAMGKNSIKVKGNTEVEGKEVQTPKKGGGVEVAEKPAVSRRLGKTRQRNDFWYLDHTGDLDMVTNEDSNAALGILSINVFDPSDKQFEKGTMAVISLDTVVGKIKGLQVRESKNSTAIYINEPSRNIAKEGEDAKWMSDMELSKQVKAQVLSYVETLLVDME